MEDSQASIQTGTQTGIQAVSEAHPDNAAMKALSELATDAKFDRAELTVTVSRENIVAACEAVKQAGYTFFEDVTAVDWYPSVIESPNATAAPPERGASTSIPERIVQKPKVLLVG